MKNDIKPTELKKQHYKKMQLYEDATREFVETGDLFPKKVSRIVQSCQHLVVSMDTAVSKYTEWDDPSYQECKEALTLLRKTVKINELDNLIGNNDEIPALIKSCYEEYLKLKNPTL